MGVTSPSLTHPPTSTLREPVPGALRRPALLAVVGSVVAATSWAGIADAAAAPNPGQSINNDYGQSAAQATSEIATQVAATPSVIAAKTKLSLAHRLTRARGATEATARAAYLVAVASKIATRIATTKSAYLAAHALTVKAQAAEATARLALTNLVATRTAAIKALHYRPVDGTYLGDLKLYIVPASTFTREPLQVRIRVYGGHLSAISVAQQAALTSDSAIYNTRALGMLKLEAMQAKDTANVAAVSGASLTSEAFQQSLQSALVRAGFKS